MVIQGLRCVVLGFLWFPKLLEGGVPFGGPCHKSLKGFWSCISGSTVGPQLRETTKWHPGHAQTFEADPRGVRRVSNVEL